MATKEEVAEARANLAKFLQQAVTLGDHMYSEVEDVISSITDAELAAELDNQAEEGVGLEASEEDATAEARKTEAMDKAFYDVVTFEQRPDGGGETE